MTSTASVKAAFALKLGRVRKQPAPCHAVAGGAAAGGALLPSGLFGSFANEAHTVF